MSKVFALYTGHGLMEPLSRVFAEELPGVRLVNVVDDSIIADVREAGSVTPAIASRILTYYRIGSDSGADVIFNTCSSVGDIADAAGPFVPVPVVRIDRAMARLAVDQGARIAVVATLPTTLEPTVRLVENEAAEHDKKVEITRVLASGAYDALVSGDAERHDDLIRAAAVDVADDVDVFVLAQGSMARMEDDLRSATGKSVYSSIRLGIRDVAKTLGVHATT